MNTDSVSTSSLGEIYPPCTLDMYLHQSLIISFDIIWMRTKNWFHLYHQSCGTVWRRTRGITTSVGSSTQRHSLWMGWVKLPTSFSCFSARVSYLPFNMKTTTFVREAKTWWNHLTVASWWTGGAVQEKNHSDHRQPLPIHQNQNSGVFFVSFFLASGLHEMFSGGSPETDHPDTNWSGHWGHTDEGQPNGGYDDDALWWCTRRNINA